MTDADRIAHLEHVIAEMTGQPADVFDGLKLTRREARVLSCITRQPGRIVSHAGIMAAVYWDRPDIDQPDDEITKVWVSKIRSKYRAAGLPDPIRTVWGQGYTAAQGETA